MVSKDNCKERVGEADAERWGCSHIFCSGFLARLMAVCGCLQSTQVGLRTMSLHDNVYVCVYFCMHACASQRVESVVVHSLTVSDKYTLTTGVKKLNALYALFFPWRLPFSASCPFPSHFYFLYFSLSYSPAFALSLAVSFFLSPLPPSLPPSISDDFSRGVTHWASGHNVR